MIKAIFPEGVTAMTVTGLTQWDYGQTLQIQASGLPALVEVHFACEGMNEAVVRSCAVTSNTLTAAIPDICLEQTSPVMAWVYIVSESSGITTLTVTLPIIARARPQPNATIPEDTSDKYTEAVAAMNAAAAALAEGDVTVARALADANGNNIPNTYAPQADVYGTILRTDLLAKVAELVAARTSRAYLFKIGGSDYDTDDNGNPVNLPSNRYTYSFVTIYTYYDAARVYLWGCTWDTTPLCYGIYRDVDGGKWSGWKEVVDSENIDEYVPDTTSGLKLTGAKSVTISNGSGDFATGVSLETGAFYLVNFSGRSSVIYKSSATNNTAAIGEYIISVSGGEQSDTVQILKNDGSAVATVSGTAYFYKMGTTA